MRTRIAVTGEKCKCDWGDVMGCRDSDLEHFRGCDFADMSKRIDGALYQQRAGITELAGSPKLGMGWGTE
jgi:hypothetical protein